MIEAHPLYILADFLAKYIHHGQLDKGGEPYIKHCKYVASKIDHLEGKVVALLHDTLEDSNYKKDDPIFLCSMPPEVMEIVQILTKNPGEDYFDYIERVLENKVAAEVKYYDLEHNIDLKRLKKKFEDMTKHEFQRYLKYLKARTLIRNQYGFK